MNKALHALVYVILIVAAVALYFEYNLYGKKELLKERNRQLEDYLVNISKTIEKADAAKPSTAPEASKDVSPVEAKQVDQPEMKNLLEDYPAQLEEQNLETMKWEDAQRIQLRKLYQTDPEGAPIPDAANPGDFVRKGPGTAQELLDQLFDRAKQQQGKLNSTRAALAETRTKLEALVPEINKLKQDSRQDKITIEEKQAQIEEVEKAKAKVEEDLSKTKTQVEEQNSEIKSLKEEINDAKEQTENVKEDLAKAEKKIDTLQKYIQQNAAQQHTSAPSAAITKLNAGNKGKLALVNAKLMFAVVEFTDDGMKELLGPNLDGALPQLEMGLRRTGFKGPAGEYVGRIRLRQAVSGKNFVIADILGDWQQTEAQKGDIVFAE